MSRSGWLVVKMDQPIFKTPRKPFGLDFIIFGNAGFVITNEFDLSTFEWIGAPATDGTLFGINPGETRVSVSRDGQTFYVLDPQLAPPVDGAFPPDAGGGVDLPTLPGLSPEDFAGATMDDIRTLYHGSGGGTAYDIDWAVDATGRGIRLSTIQYVRIDVLSGHSEIDSISAANRKVVKTPVPRK